MMGRMENQFWAMIDIDKRRLFVGMKDKWSGKAQAMGFFFANFYFYLPVCFDDAELLIFRFLDLLGRKVEILNSVTKKG